ncbi:MAG: alpha/beta fold hydrolase [Burkholderiaceae bacterium]|nr:alpha/beta fold hydrolase [Burkholderiaceae bacterium]
MTGNAPHTPRPPALPPITPEALLPGLAVHTWTAAGVMARAFGSGPTLMLLHGGTGSWTHWVRNIEALAGHFRVVVPDLPGMGESLDVPLDADLDGYGAYLLAAVEGGLLPPGEPFFIAGFSYGAVMAAWLAARMPERVPAIALLGPGGFPPGAWMRPALKPVPAGATDDEAQGVHRRNLELMMVGDPRRIDALTVAMQRRNHAMTRFKSRFLGYRDTLGPSLRATQCPVLAILGERDPLPQPDAAARAAYLEANAPRLVCRILPDASHWVAFEQPGKVNELLIEFFASRRS